MGKMVKCQFKKCPMLHESHELPAENAIAIKVGKVNKYYHEDCLHYMTVINQIKDTFINEVNPMLTGSQIAMLVNVIYNIVFKKKVDVDFLKFALDYFIKYKPGSLNYPAGLNYIIQDKSATEAWKKEQERLFKNEIRSSLENASNITQDEPEFCLPEVPTVAKRNNKSRFSNIIGG